MPSTSNKQKRFMAAAAHSPQFAKKAGIPVSVAKEFNQADKGKKFKGGGMAKKQNTCKVKKFGSGGIPESDFDKLSKMAVDAQNEFNKSNPNAPEYMKKAPTRSGKSGENTKHRYEIDSKTGKTGKQLEDKESYAYRSGGKVTNMKKLFKGKESYSEELKEGKAIKSGKITPEQYAKGEEMEKKMKKGSKCMAGGGDTAGNERLAADMVKKARSSGTASPAPVTKASGGKCMAKGGSASSRADGCATKGKTKGRII